MTDVRGLVRTTRSAATFCLGVSLIANVFFASSMLDDLNLMLMVGVIALSFAASTGSSRVIGILLFGSSIALLLHSQAPLDVWKQALRENSYLIAMFVLVPLLSLLMAAILSAIVIFAIGEDPVAAFKLMVDGALMRSRVRKSC